MKPRHLPLVELLVVIAISGLLIAILAPSLSGQGPGQAHLCLTNLNALTRACWSTPSRARGYMMVYDPQMTSAIPPPR